MSKLKEKIKTLPVRYKIPALNITYWSYISLEDVDKVRCGGNLDCSFLAAYKGLPTSFVRTSLIQAAVMAGKEYRKMHKKYF